MKITFTVLLGALMFMGCKKNLADMTEGMMFSLDMNSFLQNQVQVQIVNANYQNSATLPNAKISVTGKDAEKVYDINGSKTIVVEEQFANLAVSPGTPLQEGNPARFTIKAEAPGFLDFERELIVNNVDSFMNFTIEMIEIANPPSGIAIVTQEASLTGAQPALRIGSKNNRIQAALNVPENTKMIDDAGNRFTGNATIRVEQFDPSLELVKSNISNIIPNFTTTTFNNGIAEDFNFAPIGYLRVKIDNNSGRKLQFDQPAQVDLSLSPDLIDPISGEPLKEGDQLMVYQKDPTNLRWNLIQQTSLTADATSNLNARIRLIGADEFAITRKREEDGDKDDRPRNCQNAFSIKFKRNSNVNTLHYVAVVNASNIKQVYLNASNVAVANNSTYTFPGRLPEGKNVKVLVYQYESATDKGIVVGESGSLPSCSNSPANRVEVDVNPPSKTNNPIARFQLYTICEELKLIYLHEGRIQFRVAGSRAPYRDMGLALRTISDAIDPRSSLRVRTDDNPGWNPGTTNYSYLETDRMVDNTTYQFKTEIIGKRQKDGKTIRKTYTRNRIFNLTEFSPASQTTPINYNYFIMNRSYWIAPEDACDDFGY
jgi:hypothetical protein